MVISCTSHMTSCDPYRLFIDQSKLDQSCRDHLLVDQEGGVKLYEYDEVNAHVTELTNQNTSGKIWVSNIYSISNNFI